jgi:hypothetical protein
MARRKGGKGSSVLLTRLIWCGFPRHHFLRYASMHSKLGAWLPWMTTRSRVSWRTSSQYGGFLSSSSGRGISARSGRRSVMLSWAVWRGGGAEERASGSMETSAHSGSTDAIVESAGCGDAVDGVKRERKSEDRPAWIVLAGGGAAFGRPITKMHLSASQAVEGLVPVVDI